MVPAVLPTIEKGLLKPTDVIAPLVPVVEYDPPPNVVIIPFAAIFLIR
jgi:hypothetical protein